MLLYRHVRGWRLGVGLLSVCMVSPVAVESATAASSPLGLGRVFEANRSALVRVRSGKNPRWRQGFLLGAQGELVFAAKKSPGPTLLVEFDNGAQREGVLLGYDRRLGLAVGRVVTQKPNAVLKVATRPRFSAEQWLLVVAQRKNGKAVPHAGVVQKRGEAWGLEAPGTPGAPVFSSAGEVVAIARDRHRRRTRIWTNDDWVPFVREVVRRADVRN